ncbi:uncharacterized protein LOC115586813 [Sparus aurata]|uniref:uncharacterized protein LOC115586813 n=1 Tax=Sparus aurata TaxID=8175 RepID=UPI0011C0F4DC|nr:uncharacterized protein LOC115586813 [Sparus aurata]
MLVEDPDKRPKIYDEERPSDSEVLKETEEVFSKHAQDIHDAVFEVIKRLDSRNNIQRSETSASNRRPPHQAPEQSMSIVEVDKPSPMAPHPPTQDASHSSAKHMTDEEKEKFVDDNRADLIQEVTLVVKIAEDLKDMVNPETYDKIAAKETSQDQMRLLYRSVLDSVGKKVKAAFYDALKRNHYHLVKKHGGF